MTLRPDGDLFHGVVVGDRGLFESVGDSDRGEAIDAGDFTVAVAETRGVAGSGSGYGVATDVDAGLDGLLEEEIFDEGVHLLCFFGVAGLEGKACVGEEAFGMVEVVVVDAGGEVGRVCGSFPGIVASRKEKRGNS